jgi:tetrahydromethanopterin S-methyltransferase subunit A
VMKIEGLPVIDVDESEKITVAVRADDLLEGDTGNPDRHPIAIALRRQGDVDDARVTKNETLVPVARSGSATMPRTSDCSSSCKRH